MWKHDSESINSKSHPKNYYLLTVVFFANGGKARGNFLIFTLKHIFKKSLCFRKGNTFLGLQEDNLHTNTGVQHWLCILPGAISEAEPLHVMFYCQLGRVGTQGALAQVGQVKISDPHPKACGCSGHGAPRVPLGWGDQIGGVEHRREQGAGAASQEVLWVPGQEHPLPLAGDLGTSTPKPSWQAPSSLWGYEQLSSGHFFSALFSCRYSFPYCF